MLATRSIIAVLDALGADFGDLQRVLDQIAGRLPKYPEADPDPAAKPAEKSSLQP